MEILNTEIVNDSIMSMVIWIGLALINLIFFFANIKDNKKTATLNGILVVFVAVMCVNSILNPDEYEQIQVKVTDWNKIMNSEYEFVDQKGEIVTLRKDLE